MSPHRRNLLGHLISPALRRLEDTRRRTLNLERAPVVSEQVFVTPQEVLRKKNRRYQNYYAGPAPVNDPPIGTLMYYLGEDGHLFQFTEEGLESLDSLPPELDDARQLRVRDGVFFFNAENSDLSLHRSEDGGSTIVVGGLPAAGSQLVSFDVAADGRVWALWADSGGDFAVFYSDDLGDSWTQSTTAVGSGITGIETLACHPTDADRVAVVTLGSAGTVVAIKETTTRGLSWNSTTASEVASFAGPIEPSYHLGFTDDTLVLLYQGDLHKLISLRAGAGLVGVTETLVVDDSSSPGSLMQWYGAAIDSDVVVFIGTDDFGARYFWKSIDGGLSFTQIEYPLSDTPASLLIHNDTLYFMAITGSPETSFYSVPEVEAAVMMTPVLLFSTADATVQPDSASRLLVTG